MSAAVLWSGGKDCFAAGLRSGALADPATRLVTFVPAGGEAAFRCHPLWLMERQAAGLRLVHERIAIDLADWEASYRAAFAELAAGGVTRVITGDITPEAWPWLPAALDSAGLAFETPLAGVDDPLLLLDALEADGVVATVTGMREDVYRPGFLGGRAGRALLAEHRLTEPDAFHPCGERGEYHTAVTRFGDLRFVEGDPAACEHELRDGIWALLLAPT